MTVLPETERGRPYAIWEGTLELNTAESLLSILGADGHGPFFVAFDLASIVLTSRGERLMYSIDSLDRWVDVPADVVPWTSSKFLCTPEFTWPEDERWVVRSDYDLTSTYIAASDSIASALLQDSELEVLEVALTTRVDDCADEQASH